MAGGPFRPDWKCRIGTRGETVIVSRRAQGMAAWIAALLFGLGSVFWTGAGVAEVIHLKNGNKLEGRIEREDSEKVVLKTPSGTVSIPRRDILRIDRTRSLIVEFLDRFEAIKEKDNKGWLKLGLWCEKNELADNAVRCYERVTPDGDRASYIRARYRLALLKIEMENLRAAQEILAELADRYNSREAADLLRNIKDISFDQQREHIRQAVNCEKVGDLEGALDFYRKALQLFPKGERKRRRLYAPRDEILGKIARLRVEIAKSKGRKSQEIKAGVCKQCQHKEPSFELCPRCRGRGYVIVKVPYLVRHRGRIVTRYRDERRVCKSCKGLGSILCRSCGGTEHYMQNLDRKQRYQIRQMQKEIFSKKMLTKSLSEAVLKVEHLIMDREIFFLAALEPRYGATRDLRDAQKVFPVRKKGVSGDNAALWASYDMKRKTNYLFSYALEFAAFAGPFRFLDNKEATAVLYRPKKGFEGLESISPEEVSAYPYRFDGDWIVVRGQFAGWKEGKKADPITHVEIKSEYFHALRFYLFTPEAKARFDRISDTFKARWFLPIPGSYDFRLGEMLKKLTPGQEVLLWGRLIHRKKEEEDLFEIWKLRPGLSERERRKLKILARVLTVKVEENSLSNIASYFRLLLGVKIRLEVQRPDELITSFHAKKKPFGLILDRITRQLGLQWGFQKGDIVIGKAISKAEIAENKKLLERLRAKGGD
jgi:hypothetical protein